MSYVPIERNFPVANDIFPENEPVRDGEESERALPGGYDSGYPVHPNYVAMRPHVSDDARQSDSDSDTPNEPEGTEYEAELGFALGTGDLTGGSQLTVDAVPKDDSWRQTVNEYAPGSPAEQTQSTTTDDQQSPAIEQSPDTPTESVPQNANTGSIEDPSTGAGTSDSTSAVGTEATDATDSAQGEVAGPRTLTPGQFPLAEPDPALIEAGRVHVDALQSAGTLAGDREFDDSYLQLIGTLLGQPGSEAARALEVLISDTGGSSGPADRYVSGLVRNGAISLDEFKALANDIDFLGSLLPLFADPDAAAPTSPQANEQTLIKLGGAALGNGHEGVVDADGLIIQSGATTETTVGSSISVDGSTTVEQPETPAEGAITTPHYITADGQPFPPELQTRLDEAKAAGGIDQATLRAAQVLTGTVESSPVEQFLAQSYMGGHIDLDTYIGHLNDPDFLGKPENERAAEVLLGTAQDHDAADDFMNKIFADGHITFDEYINDVNNLEKMAALDRGVAEGKVVYQNEGFGSAEAVLTGRSDDEIKALLHPGVNLNDGPPSAEQTVALHQLAQGRDQRFVELTTQWVLHHNPGYALQFGHPTQEAKDAGEPASFFWTNNGQKVDDAFLNSLTAELSSPDGKLHFDEIDGGGWAGKLLAQPEQPDDGSLMIEVRIKYEGVTDDSGDELTDHSRHLESLIYAHDDPGDHDNLKHRLESTDGIPIGVDDHYDGEYPAGATSGKLRATLGTIDPTLTDGVQIHWVKGKDGVEIANASKLEESVVYVEASKNVHFTGNDGPLTFLAYDHENVTGTTGSGEVVAIDQPAPIVQSTADPNVPKVDPERVGFLDGKVDGALRSPESRQTIQDIMNSADPMTAIAQSALPQFAGLTPEERLYVYDKVTTQIEASLIEQGDGGDPAGTTTALPQHGANTTEVITDDPNPSYTAPIDTPNTTDPTGTAQITPEVQNQFLEKYADYLLLELGSLPPDQALTAEEMIAAIDGVVEGDPELSADEGEYLKSYARQQLGIGPAPQDDTTTTGSRSPDEPLTTDPRSPYETEPPEDDPSSRETELDTVAATLYEHFGSVEDVEAALASDPDLQAYPAEERSMILHKVVELDTQDDSKREDAVDDYELRQQQRADESNVDWDQIAITAKSEYTINGDEFDTEAFLQAVENEDDLLPTREAKDYVIETTLRFAENGDLTLV